MIFQRPNGIPTRSSSKKPSPFVSIPLSSTTSSQCPERQTSPIRTSSTYISWIAPKQDARFRSPGKNDTVIIARLSASSSAPSAAPRFASSHPQNLIVPAPRPFATFAPLRFKSSQINRHPSLATHLIPLVFHS